MNQGFSSVCRYLGQEGMFSSISHLVEGGTVARLLEIIRANPVQFVALGGFILVVVLAWMVESSAWRTRHH